MAARTVALVGRPALLAGCAAALWRLGEATRQFDEDPDSLAALRDEVLRGVIERVVLVLPSPRAEAEALALLGALDLRVGIYLSPLDRALRAAPDAAQLPGDEAPSDLRLGAIGRLPVALVADRPIPLWGRAFKRAVDVGIALVALLALAPLLLLIAGAIRLETPGPALFRQDREGRNGATFRMLKFRSMRAAPRPARQGAGVAALLSRALPLAAAPMPGRGFAAGFAERQAAFGAPAALPPPVFRQTERRDPRITRVGRLLRRTSLDELPQLINVLRGDMSLVGPRPHAVEMRDVLPGSDALAPCYARRHRVRPGLTGLAQIRGSRGSLATASELKLRLDHDLAYIAAWSPLLDLRILARTPLALVFAGGRAF